MVVSFFCKVRHDRPGYRPDRTVRTDNGMRTGLSRSDRTFEGGADDPDHIRGNAWDIPDYSMG